MSMRKPPGEDTPRARGNALFVAGDYSAAARAYSEGIKLTVSLTASYEEEQALLLANRAACYLALGDAGSAAADCRDCLQLQPCNVKALYRLAAALSPDDEAAGPAMAAAWALCEPSARTPAMLDTFSSIQLAVAAAEGEAADEQGVLLLQLPKDANRVVAASSWADVESAVRTGAALVVLRPGTYDTESLLPLSRQAYTLLGVGSVVLRPAPFRPTHAVWATGQHPPVTIMGVRLVGGGKGAAVSASDSGASLRLIDCRVQDYAEVGALICEQAMAWMDRCSFVQCTSQAIEVREGGSLVANRLSIADCKQGISAYGGAQSILLRNSTILRSKYEGVLLNGTYTNAATEMQTEVYKHVRRPATSTTASKVTDAAVRWGRQRGIQLAARLLGCTITGCKQFGVTVDSGASAVIQGCRLEGNDPHGVFVKGGSDASVLGCQVSYTGLTSKSEWYARQMVSMVRGMPVARQNGVQVGINYGGTVNVYGNAFCGPEELAIEEEMKGSNDTAMKHMARRAGLWSRPVAAGSNSFHQRVGGTTAAASKASNTSKTSKADRADVRAGADVGSARLPSLEALARRLPAWLLPNEAQTMQQQQQQQQQQEAANNGRLRRRSTIMPAAGLLQRTCHTFSLAAWAPTAHEFYAIGNTLGYDVTAGLALYDGSTANAAQGSAPSIRVLLGACGDVRNLLATISAVMPCKPSTTAAGNPNAAATTASGGGTSGRRLAFTLNDGSLSMLARDAVLLYMAAEMSAPPAAVLAVWANHGLSAAHASLLSHSLRALAEDPWPAWLTASSTLTSYDTPQYDMEAAAAAAMAEAEAPYRRAFAAWATCSTSLAELLHQRDSLVVMARLQEVAIGFSLEAVRASLGTSATQQMTPEVVEYLRTGSLRLEGGSGGGDGSVVAGPLVAANPTFLSAPELQYTVYFSSSIFRAVPLGPGQTATQRLLRTLTPQVEATAAALRSGTASVTLVHGDILAAMLSNPAVQPPVETIAAGNTATAAGSAAAAAATPMPESATSAPPAPAPAPPPTVPSFDFIDCSNVADYVSLQSLVQAATPLLERAPHARLHTESIVLYAKALQSESIVLYAKALQSENSMTHASFAEGQLVGVSLAGFEELMRLRLVGGRAVPGLKTAIRLEWAPVASSSSSAEGVAQLSDGKGSAAGAAPTAVAAVSCSITAGDGCGDHGSSAAGRRSWMTAPRLLLELLPACKVFLAGSLCKGTAPTGAPLAIVHLLTLAAPRQAEALLRALLRCDAVLSGLAALFKWELTLHVQLQAASGGLRPAPAVRRLSYSAKPGWDLIGHDGKPLLLAFSREALPRGPMEAPTAGSGTGGGPASGPVKQLLTGFAWDEDLGTAHLLLPEAIFSLCEDWYVTLCTLDNGSWYDNSDGSTGGGGGGAGNSRESGKGATAGSWLMVVGASARVSSLKSQAATGAVAPVRWRPLAYSGAQLHLGLLDQIWAVEGAPTQGPAQQQQRQRQGWCGALQVSPDGRSLTVDVLAPGPLPAPAEAAVVAGVEGDVFRVGVRPKRGGIDDDGDGSQGNDFVVQLPAGGMYGKAEGIRLSRKLGLMSARVPVVAGS